MIKYFYLAHGHHHHAGGRGGHHHGGGKHGSASGPSGVSINLILFSYKCNKPICLLKQKSRGGKQGSAGGANGAGQQPECKQQQKNI